MARGQTDDPYAVLGVHAGASDAEIRSAYRERARQLHPDVDGGDADAMRRLNDAWTILGDPDRRAAFDASSVRVFRPDDVSDADGWRPPDIGRVGTEIKLLRVLVVVMVVLVTFAAIAIFLVGFGRVGVSSSP